MMLGDRLFIAAMVIIPLFITLATGYALRYEKLNTIPIAVADEDKSDYSGTLLERLSHKEGLKIFATDKKEALEMLEGNSVEAVFIIKKDFQRKIIDGDTKNIIDLQSSPSSFSSSYVGEVVAGEVIRFIANNAAARWVGDKYKDLNLAVDNGLLNGVIEYTDSQWDPKPLMTVNYEEMSGGRLLKVEGPSMPASTATSAGIIVAFVMFFVLFSSGWLIEERRNGTLKRLVSGPDALGWSFAGSIAALMISGMLQIFTFYFIDKLAFGVELFPGRWSFVVFCVYLLAVISISMLLSSILKTPAQLQAAAPVLALLTGFIGGCFWNLVEMSKQIRFISMLTPQGWALSAMDRLLLNPGGTASLVVPVLVLLAISFVLLPLSYTLIKVQVGR